MATDTLAHPGAHWKEEDRELGLTMIALHGSPAEAHKVLKADGLDIPTRTLQDWRHRYAERLAEIYEQRKPEIDAKITQRARDVALRAFDAAAEGVEATLTAIQTGEIKDPAGATRNLVVAGATAVDKVQLLEGKPTVITEHQNPDAVFTSLANKGYRLVIDSTAEEIPEAQLAPTETGLLAEGHASNAQDPGDKS